MAFEQLKYAVNNLLHRKVRSWLTILSILIGITAIYTLVSFGLGLGNYVETLADEAGADKLFIQVRGVGAPGTDPNFFISKDDLDFVEKINGVGEISGLYSKAGDIKHKRKTKTNFVIGFDPAESELILESFNTRVVKGRNLKKGDLFKTVLGFNYQIENKIFKDSISVGEKIEINGQKFDVIGFYNEIGNPADDANIYMTLKGAEAIYDDIKDKFGFAMVRAAKGEDPEALADKIQEKLRKHKGQDKGKEDFFVQTFADAIATFGTIIQVINGILILIAFVSLIVASVNIMNTMYTAVLERTKEIGVMKAIGAKNSTIFTIFVLESGLLGAFGGILGIALGYLIAKGGGAAAAASGFAFLQPIFPASLFIGCLSFAFFTGALAGLLPAVQASKLKPADSLRYE